MLGNADRVLVVDDEELNLFIITEFLGKEDLQLETLSDPVQAWERLQAADSSYSLVILDRIMPDLDGLELLRRLKTDARYRNVPVIMQTAASAPEQVRQGLEAGAYYYLTKPYEPEALTAIVRSALEDQRCRNQLRSQAGKVDGSQRLVTQAEYHFRTLEDINHLIPVLATLSPSPDVVAPGLADLLINAVEHGNLGISYQEKALLKWEGDWEAEIERRLHLPQFMNRVATVRAERLPDRVIYTITDQGDGFDWLPYLAFDPERAFDPNGRGIAMAKLTSFASLDFQGKGNIVVATTLTAK